MKRVLILLALSASDFYHSLNAKQKSENPISAKKANDNYLFEIVQSENPIAEAVNSQINQDLNNKTEEESSIIDGLSLVEYSTSKINKIQIGQSFSIKINGSIGQDVKLTFDNDGYFSEGVRNNLSHKKIGSSVSYHYTALKPGKVKVSSQNMFRGIKQGEPQTYTFIIINKNNSKNTLIAGKAILEKKESNDNQNKEIFSDSIGLTVEASEEHANKSNLLGIVVDEENIVVKSINNQITKDLEI